MHVLIQHGNIIDGSGQKAFFGDISIHDDRIQAVGVCAEPLAGYDRILDAREAYVTPGFIDLHSHTDLAYFLPQGLRPKLMQGVTTEVTGQCGLGVAPMPCDKQAGWREQLVIGNPPLEWRWETTAEYLHEIQHHGLESHLAPFVGHGVLRYAVRADRSGALTDQELRQLQKLTAEAFESGVFGVSFGFIYVPAMFADQRELQAIVEVISHYHGLVSVHLRSESDELVEAIQEMLHLTEQRNCRLHLSHLKVIGQRNRPKIETVLQLIEDHHLSFDCYPYRAGSTTLLTILPPFVFEGGGLEETLANLREPAMRQRIIRIFAGVEPVSPGLAWDNLPALVGWENIIITDLPEHLPQDVIGHSLHEIAQQRKADPADVAMDLILAARGAVRMIDYYEDEATLQRILTHPNGMIGTDTLLGGKAHPRVFGAYPRIIHEYVFERKLLALEEAVAKMTTRPAELLGLKDRGWLRPGYAADVIIFDKSFRDRATFDDPTQFPEGLRYVIVNGQVKVEQGTYHSEKSGQLLTPHTR
jgi:N-acyl-D-aspartate/D-glutamate deacylase